ncbi:MAG: hypothetical protein IPI83_07995 [Sphingomonadales bacterium]|nr:hypothetical protein [Sphingomonadales bacterium]
MSRTADQFQLRIPDLVRASDYPGQVLRVPTLSILDMASQGTGIRLVGKNPASAKCGKGHPAR